MTGADTRRGDVERGRILPGWLLRFGLSLSAGGLFLGTLFFIASLTPTLIPRDFFTQGALSGACFAVGYAVGVGLRWLWAYLELPEARERLLLGIKAALAALCVVVGFVFLWRTAEWQNSIRELMGMEPITSAHPIKLCLVAIATFLLLIGLARLFKVAINLFLRLLPQFVPPKVSRLIGFTLAVLVFWTIANGVLFRYTLHVLDSSFATFDALIEPERAQPSSPTKTGSTASLVQWEELGRAGREYVATGPSASEIETLTELPAIEPIRVYVGLRAADTAEERAQLALAEMQRVGAFERSTLIVITPTGTGWIDPAAMDAVEYLHNGDIASVALQYSYLSSPLSLMVEPDYASEAARALFQVVYEYWTTLPQAQRPRLYLHGLSLGAMNSERSAQLFEILDDPIQGALWSGPPFESSVWRRVTDGRNAGSPAWLPEFRDGSVVRFMNQKGSTVPPETRWGTMRVIYLQYASDPVVFFDPRDFYRQPAWLETPRGPDVSPELRWYPVVTMLQLTLDMALATTTPIGYGHVYAPGHYVDAWVALTEPDGWSMAKLARLKEDLAGRIGALQGEAGSQ
ncbi:hypothetical protein FY036_22115 [Mesorhizobium microcysteis]|uniref:Alpha/beta-hydrolase family protein n=1 Tax=Neoaquamicrobium microcysteis TaxID=2682781 RepID=A0A5D4GN39_9HYPH|nr:alpha/beta-hydrolase family protein [Mesorhizobium microcysteis]TYR29554.1 hypothetical protein FY036_22115 [Mesorhizobium microcysteis]